MYRYIPTYVCLVLSVHTIISGILCTQRGNWGFCCSKWVVSHKFYTVTGMFPLHKTMSGGIKLKTEKSLLPKKVFMIVLKMKIGRAHV